MGGTDLISPLFKGFLWLTEVRHFCSRLLRGHVRFLEVLSAAPECFITCAPQWLKFGGMVDPQDMMGKPFADCCLGHAVGSLTKKGRVKDSLVLRGDVNLTQFCDSFRFILGPAASVGLIGLCFINV